MGSERYTVSASALVGIRRGRYQQLKTNFERMDHPLLLSFPQLTTPKASVQQTAKDLYCWMGSIASYLGMST